MSADAATLAWGPRGRGTEVLSWLLGSSEAGARWLSLTGILDRDSQDPPVLEAHAATREDPTTRNLLDRVGSWDVDAQVSGHDSPGFAPNVLLLLLDMGIGAGDEPSVERMLDSMLAHQEPTGRFASFGALRRGDDPAWGSLPCDNHVVIDVLLAFGRGSDLRVQDALERLAADLTATAQGPGWQCLPHSSFGWRGPGRKADVCPMVTLEALRAFSRVPASSRPDGLLDAARTVLDGWRHRRELRPYQFGHGTRFRTVKWPPTWYSALTVLDVLGRYPALWRGRTAQADDVEALAEIAACLVALAVAPDGTVTPRSVYRGFETVSFGQKKAPSPWATAKVYAVLHRLDELAARAGQVEVDALA